MMIMPETPTELEQQQSQIQLNVLSQAQDCNTDQRPQGRSTEEEPPQQIHWIRLFALIFLGFSLCVFLMGLIYYQNTGNKPTLPATPCTSAACLQVSAYLSMSADPFTQPCDYYLFTCHSDWNRGRQRRQSPEQMDRRLREETLTDRKTLLLQYLRDTLESNGKSLSSAKQKAKMFYQSCVDTRFIEMAGTGPFLKLIRNLGGWAVSGQWNQTDFNSTLGLLIRNYGTFPFFNLLVGKDPNETTQRTTQNYIQIDQPDLLIPIEWNSQMERSQVNTETLRPFLARCQRYLALLGSPPSSSMYHVGNFISLSSELAVATAPLEYRVAKGQLYQRMTIRDLQSQAPLVDWLGCLRTAFHPVPLTEDEPVLVHNLQYIVQMSRTISKWLNKPDPSNSGPLHTYMLLNLLHSMMPALDSRFRETVEQVEPRWKSCVLETERGFDSVLTHLLNERIAHAQAREIIKNIFTSVKSALRGLQWANQPSRKAVMKKVHSLTPRLWTSQKSDEAEIDLFVSEITVGTKFFWNYAQLLYLWQKRRIKLLAEQSEADDILSVMPVLRGTELIFPLGMFVPPLFHPNYPRAFNYGVIGFLIAKDILHLLLPDIHAQSETVQVVADCVWTHYLSATDKSIMGDRSLSTAQQQEVWVQYSALQIALQAYHQSLQKHPSDTSLSGFSHTHLFLTAFSQIICDSDPHHDHMPLESSFLAKVFCANSTLCPNLHCPSDKHLKSC